MRKGGVIFLALVGCQVAAGFHANRMVDFRTRKPAAALLHESVGIPADDFFGRNHDFLPENEPALDDWKDYEEEAWRYSLPPRLQKFQRRSLKGVSAIVGDSDLDVYVIGTCHVTKDSARDVRLLLETVKPHVIMVELCYDRFNWMWQNYYTEKKSMVSTDDTPSTNNAVDITDSIEQSPQPGWRQRFRRMSRKTKDGSSEKVNMVEKFAYSEEARYMAKLAEDEGSVPGEEMLSSERSRSPCGPAGGAGTWPRFGRLTSGRVE